MLPSSSGFVGVASGTAGGLAVLNPPPNQSFHAGESLSYQLPQATFVAPSESVSLTVSARLANGRPLPSWLSFNPASGSFQGTPPPGFRGELTIEVVARDNQGHEAHTTFKLKSEAGPQPRSQMEREQPIFAQGRPSLADQFARHGKIQAHAQRQALIDIAARAAQMKAG